MAEFIQYMTRASLYDGAFDSVVGWKAAGMGDIIVTDGGHLIVVDGGNYEDAEDLLSLLEAEGGGHPFVDLWIITHPHTDHYGAAERIFTTPELAARIKVQEFLYHFPEEFTTKDGQRPNPGHKAHLDRAAALAGADVCVPDVGTTRSVDGVEVEFLYTPYDPRIISGIGNENHCSTIFTVAGPNKKVMITGDAYSREMQLAVWLHHDRLACDILQMPHHGLCDAHNIEFYREVNAETVFIPTSRAGYRAMHDGSYSGNGIDSNSWCEQNAQNVYTAFSGTARIQI